MLAKSVPTLLLASNDPALLTALEPILAASGARVEIVLSPESALSSMVSSHPPYLALIDEGLPGMETSELLAKVRAEVGCARMPIVLISDTLTQGWYDRVGEGAISDVIPRHAQPLYWKLRVDRALRDHHLEREVEMLRESSTLNAQMDHLTGVYNRETLLGILFRETDRAQRLKSSLCMILFDIDDFGHWNSRLGTDVCDDLLCQVVGRTNRLLRSYDLLGRVGKDEFLVALPGCSSVNAAMLTERLRQDVFCTPFHVGSETIRLSACFGIASSRGRSPMVVLREAEQALQTARTAGPESIECFGDCAQVSAAPVSFFAPVSGERLLAW